MADQEDIANRDLFNVNVSSKRLLGINENDDGVTNTRLNGVVVQLIQWHTVIEGGIAKQQENQGGMRELYRRLLALVGSHEYAGYSWKKHNVIQSFLRLRDDIIQVSLLRGIPIGTPQERALATPQLALLGFRRDRYRPVPIKAGEEEPPLPVFSEIMKLGIPVQIEPVVVNPAVNPNAIKIKEIENIAIENRRFTWS